MFDLSKNNFAETAEAGYEFQLRLPTGDLTDAYITVRGDNSKTVKAFNRRKFTEMRQKQQIAKRRGRDEEEFTIEEGEDLAVESAIVRIISWKNIAEKGIEIPFTKENADRILREHPWIREQVMEESSLITNFRPD
jgi:hypothetical protein